MSIKTSRRSSPPPGLQISEKYGRFTADGDDMVSALQALVSSVEQAQPEANWILSTTFTEGYVNQGIAIAVTGFAYKLK